MTSAAPAIAGGFTAVYPGRADQVSQARRQVARYLAACPARDDALLVVSELATNAITHSRSSHDFLTIRCELHPNHARIEVEDAGGTWGPQTPDAERGRGLAIVDAVSAEWGIAGDTRGHVVWARLTW